MDDRTFRLGQRLTVRVPTTADHALQVPEEQRWLPLLASHVSPSHLLVAEGG